MVASGSWDKTVKLWDPRVPVALTSTLDQPERVYAMDLANDKCGGHCVLCAPPRYAAQRGAVCHVLCAVL